MIDINQQVRYTLTNTVLNGILPMLLKLYRFMTTEEIRKEYRVPAAIDNDFFATLSVFLTEADGTRIHVESEADVVVADFGRRQRVVVARTQTPLKGKPKRATQ